MLKVQSSQDVPTQVTRHYTPHKFGARLDFAWFPDEIDSTFRVCAEILKHFEKKFFSKYWFFMILDLIEVNIFGILRFPIGIHKANTWRYVIYHGISLFFHRFGGEIILSIKSKIMKNHIFWKIFFSKCFRISAQTRKVGSISSAKQAK